MTERERQKNTEHVIVKLNNGDCVELIFHMPLFYQCHHRPDELCQAVQPSLLRSDPQSQCEVLLTLHTDSHHNFIK